jgi:hypothetical protein
MDKQKNIIIFVMNLPAGTVEAVREYEDEFGGPVRIMLLRDTRVRDEQKKKDYTGVDIFASCDFSKPEKIAETLMMHSFELEGIQSINNDHIIDYLIGMNADLNAKCLVSFFFFFKIKIFLF